MEDHTMPQGYQTVMPYLIIDKASDFIQFATNVFDAKERLKIMRDDDKIMHAEIEIGESVIMLADTTNDFAKNTAGLFINVINADATMQKAVNEGGMIILPLEDRDYGRGGGVVDPFGNTWWITSMTS